MEDSAMYFPYVRGRQYELLALRELIENKLLSKSIIPIIEPVKLSPTLVKTMDAFITEAKPVAIITNPVVGSFLDDLKSVAEGTKNETYKKLFLSKYKQEPIIKSIIMQPNAESLLLHWRKTGVQLTNILVINSDREYLDLYDKYFSDSNPKYVLLPDESVFRRKSRHNKVLLDDKFEKQSRNSDYKENTDEFFSDDHLYFKEDGFIGFSDFSVVGNEYLEAGFAPYAVAIHIVYFSTDNILRVKHFVSDSNEDITNPALKFYQAVEKLVNWYESVSDTRLSTFGLKSFMQLYKTESYPGLGTVKKLSLMHHIELIGNFFAEEK